MSPAAALAVRVLLTSCVSGILLGVAARVVMRFIALESGMTGDFSLGGSLEVVLFGALVGAPVALAFFALRPRIPIPAPWAGVSVGAALFAIMALVPPPAAASALRGTPDTPAATAAAFALLFVAWGASLELHARRLFNRRTIKV